MAERIEFTPQMPITNLSGVGKTRAEKLNKLGIYTLRDLVYHFPRGYENRGNVKLLGDYCTDISCSYILTVATEVSSARLKKNLTISKFRAFDESGSVEIVFFNSPFIKDVFHVGGVFRFYGKTAFSKAKRLTLTSPKYEPVIEGVPLENHVPIYPLTEGITSKTLDKLIKKAIDDLLPLINDPLPEYIRLKYGLPTLRTAIQNLHTPQNEEQLRVASKRMAFDEMFYFALGISMSKGQRQISEGVRFSPCSLTPFTNLLPYDLTKSQKDAINDIYRDTVIKKHNGITPTMARIIVGDVGSGKTVCAEAAMFIAKMSSYQSALMVPTEILAIQHYKDISNHFEKLGIKVALLTGSKTQAQKRKIYDEIARGEIDVVIGTHALLSERVEFKNLGLIITDEQHRFGVSQRAILKDKAKKAHMLVMSATPIPRTLALALYGDLDISRITEMPKGRIRTDTYVVTEEYRSRIYAFIEKQVQLGGGCYVVCPAIENSEDEYSFAELLYNEEIERAQALKLKSAVECTEELRKALPHIKIECLHGKMKNAEKEQIMAGFVSGETKVLVSTTVIEVGVNVPSATVIVVENAERFGLSQLHQLRGRVGRGAKKSYCILISQLNTEKAQARLEVMRTTYDGYEIADKDLLLRGPGDFFSQNNGINLRQSGGFEFKFASISNDMLLFEEAFAAAKTIIETDPQLSHDEHLPLRDEVSRLTTPSSTIS